MAIDSTLPVRRSILGHLKADSDLTALVSAASIYPQSPPASPAWPFIKYGAPAGVPITGSCLDGNEITVALHGFSKGRFADGSLIETAEDHTARIGSAIAAALDKARLTILGGTARNRWTGSQLLIDGSEAGAYHTVQNFRVRVMS